MQGTCELVKSVIWGRSHVHTSIERYASTNSSRIRLCCTLYYIFDFCQSCTTHKLASNPIVDLTLGWTENWASIIQENEFRTHWLHLGMRRRLAYMARLASVKFNSDEYNMNHTL